MGARRIRRVRHNRSAVSIEFDPRPPPTGSCIIFEEVAENWEPTSPAGRWPTSKTTRRTAMKAILIAAALAVGTTGFATAPTHAASVTITTRDDGVRFDNGNHYGWYKKKK